MQACVQQFGVHMWVDMCMDIRIDTCIGMFMDVCVHMCVGMFLDVYTDICIDMRVWVCELV